MFRNFARAAFAASLLSTAAVATLAASMPAVAADQKEEKVSKSMAEPLTTAQKAATANDWPGALAALKTAQAVPDRTPYDDYVINKFLAVVAINMKDYTTARTATEAALAYPSVPDADKKDLEHNAFIFAAQGNDYAGIIKYGAQLEALGPLDDSELANMAIAYYNTKDTARAAQYAQKSIDAAKAAGHAPQQAALEIQMNGQAQANPQQAEQTLENIVAQSNDPKDWERLIEYNFGAKGMNDAIAMDLYRLESLTHSLKPENGRLAGKLGLQLRDYGDAETILESSGGGGADLATARSAAAKEKGSLNAEIAAAAKANATVAVGIAEALYGYGRFADAERIAQEAAAKGGTKYPGEAQLLVGIAQVAQGKYAQAVQTFNAISGSPAVSKTAKLWAIYAQSKAGGTAAAAPATPSPQH
jgi:hypothetical protein